MAPAPDATSTARAVALWPPVPFRRPVLTAHDGEPPAPAAPADPVPDPLPGLDPDPAPPADPPTAPEADDKPLAAAGEKALREWKERARKAEALARENTAAAARLRELEDAQKSEQERLQDAAARAQERAATAERRAVAAEIRALASDGFADPTDAVEALGGNVAEFLNADGVIDEAAIRDALTGLLDRKPHWRRPEPAAPAAPAAPPAPRPDPSQGSRPPAPPTDFMTAPDEDFRSEARRLGLRLP